jgi:predicted dithiol-disulfide oxidoreductase (DUF899 family)
MDNVGQFTLTHLAHRDVSFAVVSRGPLENLLGYKKRMSWNAPWVSSAKNTFNVDLGLTTPQGENHGLSVFVRDGSAIFRTYQGFGLPTHVFLDGDGVIRWVNYGPLTVAGIDSIVQPLLSATEAPSAAP